MLKTTLTTIKKVCVFTFVPRIWRGHVKQSQGKFEKFPTVLTQAEKSSDAQDGDNFGNKTTKEEKEKAQRIIDYTFGNGEYPKEIILEFQRAIEAELIKERLGREAEPALEYKEYNNLKEPITQETVLNASTTNQDHTNQDDENRLVQKIEKIKEAPLVEAESPKIEDVDDLKTIPPLLGQSMKYQDDTHLRIEPEKIKSYSPDEVADISQRPQPYVDFRKPNVMPLQPDPKRHVKVLFSDSKSKHNAISPEYSDITKGKLTEKEEALIKEIENISLKNKIPQFSQGVDNVQENIKIPESEELAVSTDQESTPKKDEIDGLNFEQSIVQEIDEETKKQRFKYRRCTESSKENMTRDFDTPILPLNLHEQKHNLALTSNTKKSTDFYAKSHETNDKCSILPIKDAFQNNTNSGDVLNPVEDYTNNIDRAFDEHGNSIEQNKLPAESENTNWLALNNTSSESYFDPTHDKQMLDEIHRITMKDFDRNPITNKDNNLMNIIQGTSITTSNRCYNASKSSDFTTMFDKFMKRVTRRKEKSDENKIKPQEGQTIHAVPQANWTEDQGIQNPQTPYGASQSQSWQLSENAPSPDKTASDFGTNPQDNNISFATVTPSVIDKVVYEKKYGSYATTSDPSAISPYMNENDLPKLDVHTNVSHKEPSLQKPDPTLNTPSASWTTSQQNEISDQNMYANQHEANLTDINSTSTPHESWASPQQHGTSYNYQAISENQQSAQNYVESQQESNMSQEQYWQQQQTNMPGQQYNMTNHGHGQNWQNYRNFGQDGANYNYKPANNFYESQNIGNKISRENLQEIHERMLPTPDHRGKYPLKNAPAPRSTFPSMISPHGSYGTKNPDKANIVSNYYASKENKEIESKGTNQSISYKNVKNTESTINNSTISMNPQPSETLYDMGKNVNASLQETLQQANKANSDNSVNQDAIQNKNLNPQQPYYENFNNNNPGVFTQPESNQYQNQHYLWNPNDYQNYYSNPNSYQNNTANTMAQNIAGNHYNNTSNEEDEGNTSGSNPNGQNHPLRGFQQDSIPPKYLENHYSDHNHNLNQTYVDYNKPKEMNKYPKTVPKTPIAPHNTTNSTHLFLVAEQKLKESQSNDDKNEGDVSLDIAPPGHYSDKDHYVYKQESKSSPQQNLIETSLPIMNQPVNTESGQINPSITNVYNYNSQDLSNLTPEQIKWLQLHGFRQNSYGNRYQNYYPNNYYNQQYQRNVALPNYNKNAVSNSHPVYKTNTIAKTANRSLETKETDYSSSHHSENIEEYALPRDFTTGRGEDTQNKTLATNDVISPPAINTNYPDNTLVETDKTSAKTKQGIDKIDMKETISRLNKPSKNSPEYLNTEKLDLSTPSITPKITVLDEATAYKTGESSKIADIIRKHKTNRTSKKGVSSKTIKVDKTFPRKNSPINTASTVMTADSFQQLNLSENNHETKPTQDKSPKYYERLGRLVDTAVRYKRVDVLQDETPTNKEILNLQPGKNRLDPSTLGDKYTVFTTGDTNSPSNKPGTNRPSGQGETETLLSRPTEMTVMEPVENQPNNEGIQTCDSGNKQYDYPTNHCMHKHHNPYYQGQHLQNFQTCEEQEKTQEQEFCSDVIKEINKDVQKIINSEQHINTDIKEIAKFIEQNTDKLQESLIQHARQKSHEQKECDTDVQEINNDVQKINSNVQDINRDIHEINKFIEHNTKKLHQHHTKDISGLSNDESPCQSAEMEIAKCLRRIEKTQEQEQSPQASPTPTHGRLGPCGKEESDESPCQSAEMEIAKCLRRIEKTQEQEQSPQASPTPTHGRLGPCGKEESDAKLSKLLDSIRMRNRLEPEEEMEMNTPETKEGPSGKCGDKKTCPPPPPECKPPPCPKKPCTPPTPPKCPPPKCPPPPPPDCPKPKPPDCPKPPKCDPCPPKKCCVGINESPNGLGIIMEDTLTLLMASTTVCDSGSSIVRCIRGTRDYDPWTPMPCWPVPRNPKKTFLSQKSLCPQKCLQAPPIKDGEFCKPREKPCSGFPKRLTFSLTDLNVLNV